MVVTAGRKWWNFLELTPATERINPFGLKPWSREDVVAERKNFKLLFSAGIVLAVEISNLYISSNKNDWCHSVRVTSPGNIKRLCISLSLFFSSLASRRETSLYEENAFSLSLTRANSSSRQMDISLRKSTFNICSSASFRRLFLINYSFLLKSIGPLAEC